MGNSPAKLDDRAEPNLINRKVYHGTDANFEQFDLKYRGSNTGWDNTGYGFFFADEVEHAKIFGKNIIEARITIKKPLDFRLQGIFNKKNQAKDLVELFTGDELTADEALEWLDENIDMGEIGDLYDTLNMEESVEYLKEKGYDGIISNLGDGHNEYVVFDPSQIKITSKELGKLPKTKLPPAPLPEPVFDNEGFADFDDDGLNGVPDGVISTSDLMNMRFDTMRFEGKWGDFMQNPPKNLRLNIFAKPKQGKTSLSFQLAGYLSQFGKVLYNLADQGYNPNTQELIRSFGLVDNDNVNLSSTRDLFTLENQITNGGYQFVFIDLINNYHISAREFETFMKVKFPNVGFILVMEATKSGDFKGEQAWTHITDAIVKVDEFVAYNSGRYGYGEFYIWPERYPPKKEDDDTN